MIRRPLINLVLDQRLSSTCLRSFCASMISAANINAGFDVRQKNKKINMNILYIVPIN